MARENAIPDGFSDDGSAVDSQVECDECGATVTVGVSYGEHHTDHECYDNEYSETRGIQAGGF